MIVLLLGFLAVINSCVAQLGEWMHHAPLDPEENFHLFWTPNDDEILFQVEVHWLSFDFD